MASTTYQNAALDTIVAAARYSDRVVVVTDPNSGHEVVHPVIFHQVVVANASIQEAVNQFRALSEAEQLASFKASVTNADFERYMESLQGNAQQRARNYFAITQTSSDPARRLAQAVADNPIAIQALDELRITNANAGTLADVHLALQSLRAAIVSDGSGLPELLRRFSNGNNPPRGTNSCNPAVMRPDG
jgi:hypothetical protein